MFEMNTNMADEARKKLAANKKAKAEKEKAAKAAAKKAEKEREKEELRKSAYGKPSANTLEEALHDDGTYSARDIGRMCQIGSWNQINNLLSRAAARDRKSVV